MKRLSIKARVTLWYTIFLLILVLLGAACLILFSGQTFRSQLRTQLQDFVSDTVRDTEFRYGKLESDGIDFYRDGISVFLYNTQGHLLAPKINMGIQVDSLLEDQTFKNVSYGGETYLIYDVYAVQDDTAFWVRGIASEGNVSHTLRGMLLFILFSFPVLAAIAAFGGWVITRHAFSTVEDIAFTADSINSGDNLSLRVPDTGKKDELSHLAQTINTMLERLQQSFENERRFTSDVSHELRTPVSVVLSQAEYALSCSDEEEKRTCLQAILRQGNRMSGMIAQLLMLSRADNGKFSPTYEKIDLSALCEICAAELEDSVQHAGLTLQLCVPEHLEMIADESLIIRLITNLLSNAIRYNRENGSITLTLSDQGDSCILTVADTGIGIDAEKLPHIWERFYRADPARCGEGTGLGLSIVKWIVKVHHGKISADSIKGKGTTFTILFPKKQENVAEF